MMVHRLGEVVGRDRVEGRRAALVGTDGAEGHLMPSETPPDAGCIRDIGGDDSERLMIQPERGRTAPAAPPAAPARGTFVFADIRGYTAYTHERGHEASARDEGRIEVGPSAGAAFGIVEPTRVSAVLDTPAACSPR